MEEVTKLIEELFSSEAREFWMTVYPTKINAAVLPPSSSGDEIEVKNSTIVDLPQLKLKSQLLTPYNDYISETFWSSMSSHVIQSIAGPLFSYTETETAVREKNVRAYLVEPIIRELTKHLSRLTSQSPPPHGCAQFTTTLNMEQKVRLHGGSGKPATVDFLVIVRTIDGRVLNMIPGEAKVDMQEDLHKYCKQLSKYMWKVGTCQDNPRKTTTGLIIDHHQFRIGFCPLMDKDGYIMPITFITPPVTWRNLHISQLAVSSKALLFLSTCLTGILDAQVLTEHLPLDMNMVNQVSSRLHAEPFQLPHQGDTSDVLKVMKELEVVKEGMRLLVKKDEELERKLAEKDKEIERKLAEKDTEIERKLAEKDTEIACLKVANEAQNTKIDRLITPTAGTPGSRKRQRLASEPPPIFDIH